MTNESGNAFQFDESFWEHAAHLPFTVAVPISEKRQIDMLSALADIYYTIEEDPTEAQRLCIVMAALMVASHDDMGDAVWEEFAVSEGTKNLDKELRKLLNEKL